MADENRVAVFARNPLLGAAKSRLARTIGAEAALSCYQKLLANTLSAVASFNFEIWFDGELNEDLWPTGSRLVKQPCGDLGQRMYAAFDDGVQVLIGVDCPDMSSAYINCALEQLPVVDLVLGPVEDGGYCLIAMRQSHPQLFEGVQWGTSSVLKRTLEIAAELGLRVRLLEQKWDVDDETGYRRWLDRQKFQSGTS